MEIWKNIDGFQFYQVSNYGRIKSLARKVQRKHSRNSSFTNQITIHEKIISGWISYSNTNKPIRISVVLRNGKSGVERRVHHLVLEAFVGPRPKNMEACHNDGNPLNNHIDNLRWDTKYNNYLDQLKHKTNRKPPTHHGENHPRSRFKKSDIKYIRSLPYVKGLFTQLAKQYNVAIGTIGRIYKGEGWETAKG